MHPCVGHDENTGRLRHWTGCRLVNTAQMAGVDDAADCLRSDQDQQHYHSLVVEDDIKEGAVPVDA
jgi:hypothetical protein